jgi:hypothetical protein
MVLYYSEYIDVYLLWAGPILHSHRIGTSHQKVHEEVYLYLAIFINWDSLGFVTLHCSECVDEFSGVKSVISEQNNHYPQVFPQFLFGFHV